ncbi:unnamed protein product, partial [Staurois parvus]
ECGGPGRADFSVFGVRVSVERGYSECGVGESVYSECGVQCGSGESGYSECRSPGGERICECGVRGKDFVKRVRVERI